MIAAPNGPNPFTTLSGQILHPRAVITTFGASTSPDVGVVPMTIAQPGGATAQPAGPGFTTPTFPVGSRVRTPPSGPAPDTNPATQPPGTVSIFQPFNSPTPAPPVGTSGTGSTTGTGTSNSGAPATTGSPLDTSGGPVGSPSTDSATQTLLDLIAAQYAGAQGSGQNPDFGGLLTAPVNAATGSDTTGTGTDTSGTGATTSSTTSSSGSPLLVILLIVGVVGAIWWWRKHHKKKAA